MSNIEQFYELKKDVQKILSKLNNIISDLEYYNNITQIKPPINNDDSLEENSEDDKIASNIKYAINTINSDLKFYKNK